MSRSLAVTCWLDRSFCAPDKQTSRWSTVSEINNVHPVLETWCRRRFLRRMSPRGRGTTGLRPNGKTHSARGGRGMIFGPQQAAPVRNASPRLSDCRVNRCGRCISVTSHQAQEFSRAGVRKWKKKTRLLQLEWRLLHFLATAATCCSACAGLSLLSKKYGEARELHMLGTRSQLEYLHTHRGAGILSAANPCLPPPHPSPTSAVLEPGLIVSGNL